MQKSELGFSKRTTVPGVITGMAELSPGKLENLMPKLRNWSGKQKCLSLNWGVGRGSRDPARDSQRAVMIRMINVENSFLQEITVCAENIKGSLRKG